MSDANVKRKFAQTAALIVVSLLIAIGIAEVAARALGFKPWGTYKLASDHVPRMNRPDPALAWVPEPGEYNYAGYTPDVEQIQVTILPNSSRQTGPNSLAAQNANDRERKKIIFVGGSVTMGFAISDHESFAWKIQEKYPEAVVYNFGTPGYGTYQSLIVLEQNLPDIHGEKLVIYGFIGHHIQRNVASASWVNAFSIPGKEGKLPPFATLDGTGNIVRHPVSYYPPWPLKDRLAIVNMLDTAFVKLMTRTRNRQKYDVTQQLVLTIDKLSQLNDAKFVVAMLNIAKNNPATDRFKTFMRDNDISFADCIPPEITPDFQVKGEGHPNGKANTRIANCIADFIEANKL